MSEAGRSGKWAVVLINDNGGGATATNLKNVILFLTAKQTNDKFEEDVHIIAVLTA